MPNLGFQGYVNFGNDTNNALDTGFGFANAAVGVFTQYLQQSKLIEGSMIYNNTEFYLQDNWKVNPRLTLDYGVRFTHQQPQHDQFLQMSNFFPNEWRLGSAPLLYVAGCSNGATVCSGNARNAVDPRTGQIVTAPGAANSAALIGTVVPNTGNVTNGVHQAGDGIADTLVRLAGARGRAAVRRRLRPDRRRAFVLRGGGGLFFDRPDGNTVFSIPGNPPISTAQDLRNGQLSTLGTGLASVGVPSMIVFQYDAEHALVVAVAGWRPDGAAVVGDDRRLLRRQPRLQPAARVPGWRERIGRPQRGRHWRRLPAAEPGSDARPERGAGRERVHRRTCCAPSAASATSTSSRRGSGTSTTGCSSSLNRRFANGLAFGTNYNLGLSFKGNTGLQLRLQHAADGTLSVRPDQAQYEQLNENLAMQRHVIKSFAVWDIPDRAGEMGIGREGDPQRLAAFGRAHRGFRVPARGDPGQRRNADQPHERGERPLRHHLHVSERRHRTRT